MSEMSNEVGGVIIYSGFIPCQQFVQEFTKRRVTVQLQYNSLQEGSVVPVLESLQPKKEGDIIT